MRTARETPVLVAVGEASPAADRSRLSEAGCEVFVCHGETPAARLDALLVELGRRRLTNVLVEGGGRLLGSLLDARQIDEVHVFIAPKLLGGATARTPLPARELPRSPRRCPWRSRKCSRSTAIFASVPACCAIDSAARCVRRRRETQPGANGPRRKIANPRTFRGLLAPGYSNRAHGPMLGGFLARKSRGPRFV